jgi:hypothetical protein
MGITIHQSPTGFASAHEEVWHVVESTDKNITGFQYVYDIYKGAELLTRVKNSPLGASKLGVLDVGNIVRSALDSYSFPAFNLAAFTNEVTLGADIFFTDYDVRYGQVSGVGEVSGNLASGTYRVYNNYKRSKWDNATSEISADAFLTNRPSGSTYYPGEPIVASVYVGSEDRSRLLTTSYGNASKYYNTSGQYNLGYTFGILPVSGTITFDLQNENDDVIDTITFKQMRWGLSGNSMVEKIGSVYNESMKTYAVKYKERMMLTSDILSTGEYNWLSELINSPQVYYYSTENAEYYPVQITDSDYEFKDDRINKTDTLSVTIEFSTPQNTQYR